MRALHLSMSATKSLSADCLAVSLPFTMYWKLRMALWHARWHKRPRKFIVNEPEARQTTHESEWAALDVAAVGLELPPPPPPPRRGGAGFVRGARFVEAADAAPAISPDPDSLSDMILAICS